jgi:hypothetical protein
VISIDNIFLFLVISIFYLFWFWRCLGLGEMSDCLSGGLMYSQERSSGALMCVAHTCTHTCVYVYIHTKIHNTHNTHTHTHTHREQAVFMGDLERRVLWAYLDSEQV